MTQKKVMFFDIDGTLLPAGENKINPITLAKIQESRSKGNLMFINTGRTLSNLDENILNAGFDGFVCACGSYILIDGKLVYYRHADDIVCNEIVMLSRKCRIDAVYESCHGIFYDPKQIELDSTKKLICQLQKDGMVSPVMQKNFDKFVIFKRPDSHLEEYIEAVCRWYDCIDREHGFYEFVPKGCSKATGIQFVLNYFNLPLSCTYAIGDSSNDLSMLSYVSHSIAMGNSDPKSLFEKVEYVTFDIANSGVVHALEHFGF